jgi:hypothetical protein
VKSISTTDNLIIKTKNNTNYLIEIRTYLGTTVFKDNISPKNNTIKITGLNPGKYIIHISNKYKSTKKQINILNNN